MMITGIIDMGIIDEEMAEQYGILHAKGKFPGKYPAKYGKKIHALIKDTDARYLLDYADQIIP